MCHSFLSVILHWFALTFIFLALTKNINPLSTFSWHTLQYRSQDQSGKSEENAQFFWYTSHRDKLQEMLTCHNSDKDYTPQRFLTATRLSKSQQIQTSDRERDNFVPRLCFVWGILLSKNPTWCDDDRRDENRCGFSGTRKSPNFPVKSFFPMAREKERKTSPAKVAIFSAKATYLNFSLTSCPCSPCDDH